MHLCLSGTALNNTREIEHVVPPREYQNDQSSCCLAVTCAARLEEKLSSGQKLYREERGLTRVPMSELQVLSFTARVLEPFQHSAGLPTAASYIAIRNLLRNVKFLVQRITVPSTSQTAGKI